MAVFSMDRLPLGFRFRPTDEELINHYLRLKVNGLDSEVQVIPEVDVCKWEPWDLPGLSVIKSEDPEWFFFCPLDRKYPNGHRSNRATDAGYWKATGKDRTIKSSRPNQSLIGMKKTLVFYRGRAPRGQRTHWIMHEYRPTLKELDGTGPGQSAFVICRLFRKPELKIEGRKNDDVEDNGSSRTTTKSSPDDTLSDLVQEAETSALKEGTEIEETEKQFDQLSNVAPNCILHVPSCSNSHMASDGQHYQTVVTPAIEHTPLIEKPNVCNPMNDKQVDSKVFSPPQLQILAELTRPYMDSPYASDFGYDHEGLLPQNGSCEDVSFSDLFDGIFTNNDEFSGKESTVQKNSVVKGGTHIYSHTKAEMPGLEYDPSKELLPSPASSVSWPFLGEESRSNVCDLGNISFGQDALSGGSAIVSFYDNVDGSIRQNNPLDYGSNGSGIGIEIRNRQPQLRPNPNNFATQGNASRRIHLLKRNPIRSFGNGKVNDSMYFVSKDEVLPSLTEASKSTNQNALAEKSVDGKTTHVGATKIKISTRRIRWLHRRGKLVSKANNSSSETVSGSKIGDASCGEDEDGVHSAVSEAPEVAVPGMTFKSENETQVLKIEGSCEETVDHLSGKPKLRASRCDNPGSQQIARSSIIKAPSPMLHSQSSFGIYSGSIILVVVISMVSIGVWMCGR